MELTVKKQFLVSEYFVLILKTVHRSDSSPVALTRPPGSTKSHKKTNDYNVINSPDR